MSEFEARARPGMWGYIIMLSLLVSFSAIATYVILTRLNLLYFLVVLGGIIGVFLLFRISTKDLSVALILWLLSMSGFQYTVRLAMPGLPDLSIDRLLLIWIIIMFLLQLVVYKRKLQGPFTLDVLIITHTVYIFVSMLFSKPTALPAWLMSSLMPLFAYLYGRHIIKDDKQIRIIFLFFLGISVYFFITAIGEHFRWHQLVWPKAILDPTAGQLWHPGRARGPVMHPPLFGQLIAMLIPVYFFFLTRRTGVFTRFLLAISLSLSLVALLLAYTRGPWLAAAVSFLVLGALRNKYRKALGVLAVIGLLVGTLGLFQLADSDFLQERIGDEGTTENRFAFFLMSVKMIADHPLVGVGFFCAKEKHWLYNQGGYIPFYGYISKRSGRGTVPHDIYLGRAADEGLISIIMLMSMGVIAGREFLRKWRIDPPGRWFNRDAMAVMVSIGACYLAGGMVIDYRYFDLINVIVYLLMGIVCGFPVESKNDPERLVHV